MAKPIGNFFLAVWIGCVFLGSACSDSDSPTNNVGNSNDSRLLSFQEHFTAHAKASDPTDADFRMTIASMGVSSAFVKLNGDELFGPSDFHNKSFEKTVRVSLLTNNQNEIEVEVRGSPGDQLCVRIYEVTGDGLPNEFFNRCVDRTAGPPNHVDETFGITRVKLLAAGFNEGSVSGVTVSDARLVFGNVSFQPLGVCQGTASARESVDFHGPYVTNLLTDQSIPLPGSAYVTTGTYCGVDLKLDQLGSDEVPSGIPVNDPIVGTSLLMHGTRSSDATPLTLTINVDDPFQMRNASGFALEGMQISLFLAYDLAHWFDGVDLSTAVLSNGAILINSANNTALYDHIKANVTGSSRLFKDENDNGILEGSESETADILASGTP